MENKNLTNEKSILQILSRVALWWLPLLFFFGLIVSYFYLSVGDLDWIVFVNVAIFTFFFDLLGLPIGIIGGVIGKRKFKTQQSIWIGTIIGTVLGSISVALFLFLWVLSHLQ